MEKPSITIPVDWRICILEITNPEFISNLRKIRDLIKRTGVIILGPDPDLTNSTVLNITPGTPAKQEKSFRNFLEYLHNLDAANITFGVPPNWKECIITLLHRHTKKSNLEHLIGLFDVEIVSCSEENKIVLRPLIKNGKRVSHKTGFEDFVSKLIKQNAVNIYFK